MFIGQVVHVHRAPGSCSCSCRSRARIRFLVDLGLGFARRLLPPCSNPSDPERARQIHSWCLAWVTVGYVACVSLCTCSAGGLRHRLSDILFICLDLSCHNLKKNACLILVELLVVCLILLMV